MKTLFGDRQKCYKCYRPVISCMCKHICQVDTNTKFIILMHPKEFKKVKNGTGHFTHLALNNSELFIGVDFTNHHKINKIISTHQSFVLYPSKDAINISTTDISTSLDNKINMAIFIIDSTWSCSIKMLKKSKNLQKLEHLSFSTNKLSEFKIKQQPEEYCLSTIESTLCILEDLNRLSIENIDKNNLSNFLNPFHKMIEYQIKCIDNPLSNAVRYKPRNNY